MDENFVKKEIIDETEEDAIKLFTENKEKYFKDLEEVIKEQDFESNKRLIKPIEEKIELYVKYYNKRKEMFDELKEKEEIIEKFEKELKEKGDEYIIKNYTNQELTDIKNYKNYIIPALYDKINIVWKFMRNLRKEILNIYNLRCHLLNVSRRLPYIIELVINS